MSLKNIQIGTSCSFSSHNQYEKKPPKKIDQWNDTGDIIKKGFERIIQNKKKCLEITKFLNFNKIFVSLDLAYLKDRPAVKICNSRPFMCF
jgi:hypothetical protein